MGKKNFVVHLICLYLLAFSQCTVSSPDKLYKDIFSGQKISAELILETNDVIVALDHDNKGILYAVTEKGELLKIEKSKKMSRLYSGIKRCGFSWASVAVAGEDLIIINECVKEKNVLTAFNSQGAKVDFFSEGKNNTIAEDTLSLCGAKDGTVYAGVWTSKGNLSVNMSPYYIYAAEYIKGKIIAIKPGQKASTVYEGGLPLSLAVSPNKSLYAAVWGKEGPYNAEMKNYSVADPRHMCWIVLSEKSNIITADNKKTLKTGLNAISSIAADDKFLFAYGISKKDKIGIFLIEDGKEPVKIRFSDEKIDQSITGLTLSGDSLYFANADGKLYKTR